MTQSYKVKEHLIPKSPAMFLLLVSFALIMGFAFSTANDFTRRPLINLSPLGVVIALLGFPIAYAYICSTR